MRISYRQGIIAAQPNFLQIGLTDGRYVDLIVSPSPIIVALANRDKDYLIGEHATVTNAWGPFTSGRTQYLYWDINQATGQVTYGATELPPIYSATAPAPFIDQMWWNSSINEMTVYNGSRWVPVLRVMAGTLSSGGILIQSTFTSQAGLNTPADAGFIVTDGLNGVFKNSAGDFLTTETGLTSIDTGSLVKLEGNQVIAQANENIPKFSLVYLVDGRAALASGNPPLHETRAPIAAVTMTAYQNDTVMLATAGQLIVNDQWNWNQSLFGKSVYCGAFGEIVTIRPLSQKSVRVGTIMNAQSVLLSFDWETEPTTIAGGVVSVLATAPLSISGTMEYPNVGMPKATTSIDGYIAASDFIRIPALENALLSKSDIGHIHVITDVDGLQSALNLKSPVGHTQPISSITDLQMTLDGKSNVGHSHIIADVDGLQLAINNLDSRILLKADRVVGATAGDFASLSASGNLVDSTFNASSFALASHMHTISDVMTLQLALDNRSLVGHTHPIAEVVGLQIALDDKAFTIHIHTIDQVTGLQSALDGKSDLGHIHIISDVTGLQIALDGKSPVDHAHLIADVTGLQGELDNRSLVGHTHVIANVTGLQLALDSKADINHTHPTVTVALPVSEIAVGSGTGLTSSPAFIWEQSTGQMTVNSVLSGYYTSATNVVIGAKYNPTTYTAASEVGTGSVVLKTNNWPRLEIDKDGNFNFLPYVDPTAVSQNDFRNVNFYAATGLDAGTTRGADFNIYAGNAAVGTPLTVGGGVYLYSGTSNDQMSSSSSINIYGAGDYGSMNNSGDIDILSGDLTRFAGEGIRVSGNINIKAGDVFTPSALVEGPYPVMGSGAGDVNIEAGYFEGWNTVANVGDPIPAINGSIKLKTARTTYVELTPFGELKLLNKYQSPVPGNVGDVLTSGGLEGHISWEPVFPKKQIFAMNAATTFGTEIPSWGNVGEYLTDAFPKLATYVNTPASVANNGNDLGIFLLPLDGVFKIGIEVVATPQLTVSNSTLVTWPDGLSAFGTRLIKYHNGGSAQKNHSRFSIAGTTTENAGLPIEMQTVSWYDEYIFTSYGKTFLHTDDTGGFSLTAFTAANFASTIGITWELIVTIEQVSSYAGF